MWAAATVWATALVAVAHGQVMDEPGLPPAPVTAERGATPEGPSAESPEIRSPRAAMRAFLEGMWLVSQGYDEGWAKVFPTLGPPDQPPDWDADTPEAATYRRAAEALHATIDRIGKVDYLDLPDRDLLEQLRQDPQQLVPRRLKYFPTARHGQIFQKLGGAPDGEIVFASDDQGVWRFTPDTVLGAEALYASMKALPLAYTETTLIEASQIVALFGPTFDKTPLWSWIGLLGLIFVGLAVGKVLQTGLRALGGRLQKDRRRIRGIVFESAASPVSLLCLTVGLMFGFQLLHLGEFLQRFSGNVIRLLLIIAAGWLLFNLVDIIDATLQGLSAKTKSKLDDQIVPLVRKSLRIFLLVVLSLMAARSVFGLDITGWLAGLGIAGLAISLAAQDSVRNLFGSITVLFDKPFTVGDWVVIGDVEGTVEEVGFRSTRIRTFYNSQVTFPNANLINASVDNMGRRKYRRWSTHVGVQYDTPPGKLVAFTEGIRELIRTHPYTRKDYYQVWMHQWSDSSMDVLLYVFFEVPDWNTELRERDRLFVDIVRLADRLGVQFAFPTRTVHLFQEEHAEPTTQHDPPTSMTDRRSMIEGIRAAQRIDKDQPWMAEKPGPMVYDKEGPSDVELTDAGDPVPEPPATQARSDHEGAPLEPGSRDPRYERGSGI